MASTLDSGCSSFKKFFHKEEPIQIEHTIKSMPLEKFLKDYTPPLCSNAVTYGGFYNGYDNFILAPPEGTVYGAKTGKTYTLIDFANILSMQDDEIIAITANFIKEYTPKIKINPDQLKIKRENSIRVDIYSIVPIKGRTIKQLYGYHIIWKPSEVLKVQRDYIQRHIETIQNNFINNSLLN